MRNLNCLNKYRIEFWGSMGDETCGAFEIEIFGRKYFAMASCEMGWEHVSISNPHVTPSWDVMCKVKNLFFEEEERVCQYHPPKSEYVNNHKHCLHLWKPIDEDLPFPPSILVGTKNV